ncbi:MAG: hypothetical protein S4CHLAM45_09110 [Chlamydiales bacterium]|nr:hypothetical protein [Chlamydiales bacterium]MCH9620537.1 hypothetical protein [Chlamydiales bacterium]MCH9623015.1 hypothetical protein [Chlamydiales bacterium]
MEKQADCPCHSGKPYETCCAPYHNGEAPPSPLALMRSRYSGYALGNIDYILKTGVQDENSRKGLEHFCNETQFVGLEILEESGNTVTFKAILERDGVDTSFIEKSLFEKRDGRWIYLKRLA